MTIPALPRESSLNEWLVYVCYALLVLLLFYSGGDYIIDRLVRLVPVEMEKELWDYTGANKRFPYGRPLTPVHSIWLT